MLPEYGLYISKYLDFFGFYQKKSKILYHIKDDGISTKNSTSNLNLLAAMQSSKCIHKIGK